MVDETLREQLAALQLEVQRLREEVGGLREYVAKLDGQLGGVQGWLLETSDRVHHLAGQVEATGEDQAAAQAVLAQLAPLPVQIAELERRVADDCPLTGTDGLRLERFDAGHGGEVLGFRPTDAEPAGAVYRGFEDFFRGSEEAIRERQRSYLPLLAGRGPVLDVGCGRGEMLELLRDQGTDAIGIDLDEGMVARCRAKGLDRVELADAVEYLQAAAEGSIGAVFAAQVVEHFPYDSLLRFLRAARAALVPEGLVIAETVNPHMPQALKHFWIDPTHQHPLFPEVMLALCALTGYAGAYVFYPQGTGDPDRDRAEQMDYAVVAHTPARRPS